MLTILLDFLKDFAVWLIVFSALLGVSMRFGIDTLRTIVFSLYMSVLLWLMVPFRSDLFEIVGDTSLTRLLVFSAVFAGMIFVLKHALPGSFERPFEFLHKKALYAFGASVLVIIIGAHVLAITTPTLLNSAPLVALFGDPTYSFYWFIAPLFLVTLL